MHALKTNQTTATAIKCSYYNTKLQQQQKQQQHQQQQKANGHGKQSRRHYSTSQYSIAAVEKKKKKKNPRPNTKHKPRSAASQNHGRHKSRQLPILVAQRFEPKTPSHLPGVQLSQTALRARGSGMMDDGKALAQHEERDPSGSER